MTKAIILFLIHSDMNISSLNLTPKLCSQYV